MAPVHSTGYVAAMILRSAVMGVACALVLGACDCGKVAGGSGGEMDASVEDAGVFVPADAGAEPIDAGAVVDAGQPTVDAGTLVLEAAALGAQGDLLLLQLDGGSRTLVAHVDAGIGFIRAPRWSPDGTRLAFADGTRAYVLEADGTVTRPHTMRFASGAYGGTTTRVEWSSDGQRLAIDGVNVANDAVSVFVVPLDAGLPELVGEGTRWAWEKDGPSLLISSFDLSRLVFVTRRYDVASADGGVAFDGIVLDVGPAGFAVVQHPEVLADGGAGSDVVLTRTRAGDERLLLAPGGPTVSDGADNFLVSGNSLEVAARASTVSAPASTSLFRVAVDGGAPLVLFDGGLGASDLPRCFRWVPGSRSLSIVLPLPTVGLFLSSPDGGLIQVPTPALGSDAPGCLDWRLRRE
jgi:dipeptidyl aminopeptidase/acylaminoacyl peptidase